MLIAFSGKYDEKVSAWFMALSAGSQFFSTRARLPSGATGLGNRLSLPWVITVWFFLLSDIANLYASHLSKLMILTSWYRLGISYNLTFITVSIFLLSSLYQLWPLTEIPHYQRPFGVLSAAWGLVLRCNNISSAEVQISLLFLQSDHS